MTGILAAQLRMELTLALRRGEAVLLTLIIPLALLLFFGTTSYFGIDIEFLVPGLLTLAVLSSAFVSLAIATGFDRKYMVLKRLGATPLPRWALFLAKVLAVLVLEVVQIALIVGVAALVFDFGLAFTWGPFILGVLLGTLAFAGLALLIAGTMRAEATLALSNGLYVIFLGIGGVMFPTDSLAAPLQALAELLPAAALSEILRASVENTSAGLNPWLVLAIWASVSPLLAVRFFTWEEH